MNSMTSCSTPAPTVPNCRPVLAGRGRDGVTAEFGAGSTAGRGRRQDVDLTRIINDGIADFVGDRCLLNPNSRVSTDSMEGVGQLPSRGFGAVRHQGNAHGGHRAEGSPTLLKGWKSTAQCSKCSNWPSTHTTDFLGLCRSAALAALDLTHAKTGEMRAT